MVLPPVYDHVDPYGCITPSSLTCWINPRIVNVGLTGLFVILNVAFTPSWKDVMLAFTVFPIHTISYDGEPRNI